MIRYTLGFCPLLKNYLSASIVWKCVTDIISCFDLFVQELHMKRFTYYNTEKVFSSNRQVCHHTQSCLCNVGESIKLIKSKKISVLRHYTWVKDFLIYTQEKEKIRMVEFLQSTTLKEIVWTCKIRQTKNSNVKEFNTNIFPIKMNI